MLGKDTLAHVEGCVVPTHLPPLPHRDGTSNRPKLIALSTTYAENSLKTGETPSYFAQKACFGNAIYILIWQHAMLVDMTFVSNRSVSGVK